MKLPLHLDGDRVRDANNRPMFAVIDPTTAAEIVRKVNSADKLAEQLRESQDLLRAIYNGKFISGLLDCIDSNAAALKEWSKPK